MSIPYHDDYSAVSKTMLSVFCDDPYKYFLEYVQGTHKFSKKQTRQLAVGTICHAVLLEAKQLVDVCAIYPKSCLKSDGAINSKPAEAFRIDMGDKSCLKAEDFDRCVRILDAIAGTPLADAIRLSSEREQEHRALIEGLLCKCRPDFACEMNGLNHIWDLKFQEDCSQPQFRRSAKRFRYWLQDAHYSAVKSAENGLPSVFRFFIVEAKEPFRIRSYWFEGMTRQGAADTHKRKLLELAECLETNEWDDGQGQEITLSHGDMDWHDEEETWQG